MSRTTAGPMLVADDDPVRLEQLAHRGRAEPLQHDHRRGAAQPLDPPPVARRHEHDERPKPQLLGDEHEKIDRDVVDDVAVVDDQHDRLPLGRLGEQRGDVLEQSRAAAAGAQPVDQLRAAAELTHDRGPGPAARAVADRAAGHPQHPHRCVPRPGRERLRERGLARTPLAEQHQRTTVAAPRPRRARPSSLRARTAGRSIPQAETPVVDPSSPCALGYTHLRINTTGATNPGTDSCQAVLVDDDGLEPIDLALESVGDDAPPRPTVRRSRRRVVVLGAGLAALAVAGGLFAHDRSNQTATGAATPTTRSRTVVTFPTTRWVPPAGLSGLASGPSVAVVLGTPLVVGDRGRVQKILEDIPGIALVDTAQDGAALVQFKGGPRVIVGPDFGSRNVLPAAIALLPDADGRWWSNFGEVGGSTPLRAIRFPAGMVPVAKLRRGYLLVDDAHTGLFEWRSPTGAVRIARGDARILAIAGELVAWTGDGGSILHVTNVGTGRTVDARTGNAAVTARFSPDRSRLAILSGDSITESMTLVDTASGAGLANVVTASGGNGLAQFDDVPPAFQPVPFGWDATGRLVVIAQTTVGYFLRTVDSVSGSVVRTVAAPEGLQQLISLAP